MTDWGMCSVEGCDRQTKGMLCRTHHEYRRRGKELRPIRTKGVCSFPDCGRGIKAHGLCDTHDKQRRAGSVLHAIDTAHPGAKPQGRLCSFRECGRKHQAKGLCSAHYQQQRLGRPVTPIHVAPKRLFKREGYVLVTAKGHPNARPDGRISEHVKVMTEVLGRPLLPGENVHHKNGVKRDNHPGNLELWIRHQPCGQRVHDVVQWAREIERRYGAEYDSGLV